MNGAHYYVRFGDVRHVGRFPSLQVHAPGERVVIQSRRGLELGQVLNKAECDQEPDLQGPRIVRLAGPQDEAALQAANADRIQRFEACRNWFDQAVWPLQLIDIEPLLEPGRTVVYYLGPHGFDFEGIRQSLRDQLKIDVAFEPVGRDAEPEEAVAASGGCSSCGSESGGCGSGEEGGACGTGGGGCCS